MKRELASNTLFNTLLSLLKPKKSDSPVDTSGKPSRESLSDTQIKPQEWEAPTVAYSSSSPVYRQR